MPDDVRSSSRTGARGSSRSTWRSRPRRSFGPTKELSGNATAFADSSDRLVRRLFDTGLRLHKLRMVFDRPDPSAAELRTASDAIAAMLDDLDGLIRETGLAMLDIAHEHDTETTESLHNQPIHDGRLTNRRGRLR
ncbi:hypothetical protein [Nocardia anaemiae]|uniref:hypothetical protein n=1 Tax=Nocardia anaemiae TaxID=263910 RepID=UPI0007A3C68F|nr:hypothetical protein [Nocardia anaemiae]